jgi:hypothetical protein
MNTAILKKMLVALLVFSAGNLFAYTAVQSGAWSNAATWGGTGPGNTVTTQSVIIPVGITVTLDVGEVTFDAPSFAFTVNGMLNTSVGGSLIMLHGTLNGAGDINIHRIKFNQAPAYSFNGAIIVDNFQMVSPSLVANLNSEITVNDTLDLHHGIVNVNSGANLVIMPDAWIVCEEGEVNGAGGTFTTTNYNVSFIGPSHLAGLELTTNNVDTMRVNLDAITDVLTFPLATATVNVYIDHMQGIIDLSGTTLTLNGDYDGDANATFDSDVTGGLIINYMDSLTSPLMFQPGASVGYFQHTGGIAALSTPLTIDGDIRLIDGHFQLRTGGNIIMANDATVRIVDGHFDEDGGLFTGILPYNVEYFGQTHNTRVEVTGPGLTNITINQSAPTNRMKMSQDITLPGALTMINGGLSLEGFDLTLNGTLNQAGNTFIIGDSTSGIWLNLTSSVNDSIFFDDLNPNHIRVDTFVLNIPSGSTLTLGTDMRVDEELQILSGRLNIGSSHLYLDGDYVATAGVHLTSNPNSEFTIVNYDSLSSYLNFSAGSSIGLFEHTGGIAGIVSPLTIAANGMIKLGDGHFQLRPGGNIIMGNNANVRIVDGHFDEDGGSFTGVQSYNVQYYGQTHFTRVELTGPGLMNITINQSASTNRMKMAQDITLPGTLTILNGGLSLEGYDLRLNGAFDQAPNTFVVGDSTSAIYLNMVSSVYDTLYFDAQNPNHIRLDTLVVNIPAGSVFTLGTDAKIYNSLRMNSGRLRILQYDLEMKQGSNITGYSDTRYIITADTGTLIRYIPQSAVAVVYPIGVMFDYSPTAVQQTSAGSSGMFGVRVANGVYDQGMTGNNYSNTYSVVDRTWFMHATDPNTTVNMNMTVGWQVGSEFNGFNRNSAWVSHYGTSWDVQPTGSATVGLYNTYELSRSGITGLSPFAVFDNMGPLSVPGPEPVTGVSIYPNPVTDFVTLNVDNSANAVYRYEIFDATGKLVMSFENSEAQNTIDMTAFENGYYLVKVTNLSDNTYRTEKVVKQ